MGSTEGVEGPSIEEMEMEMYGTQSEEGPANPENDGTAIQSREMEEGNGEPTSVEVAAETEVITQKGPGPEATQEVEGGKQDSENWEKRFKNYKGSTDPTIHQLRVSLAAIKKDYSQKNRDVDILTSYIHDMEQKGEGGGSAPISQEARDYLGDEGVDAIQESVDAAVKPLKKQLKDNATKEEERNLREAKDLEDKAYNTFYNTLEDKVPDYREVNVDPGFIEYLDGKDKKTGYPLKELFALAEQRGDAKRVAHFFNTYKKSKGSMSDMLDANITPTSSAASVQSPNFPGGNKNFPPITEEFIDKFYEDVNKGKYTTKEADEIETRIDATFYG